MGIKVRAFSQVAYETPRVTPTDDVFSLGCIMFELIVGEPLFDTIPRTATLSLLTSTLEFDR